MTAQQPATQPAAPAANVATFSPSHFCQDLDRESTTYWDNRATELKEKELESVRAAAATWKNAVTAFAGVGVVLAVFAATDNLQKLEQRQEALAAIVLLLALFAAIGAILEFARAEAGPLSRRLNTAENTCELLNEEPVEVARATKRGRLLAVLSLALYIGAMAGIAYWSKDPASAAAYVGVSSSDAVVCGTLRSDANGSIQLVPQVKDQSKAEPIDVKPGTELQEVKSCGVEE